MNWLSLTRSTCGLQHGAAGEHPSQVRSVLGAGVNVTLHVDSVCHCLNRGFDGLFFGRFANQGLLDGSRPVGLGANPRYANAR